MSATPGSQDRSFSLSERDRENEGTSASARGQQVRADLSDEVLTIKDEDNANQDKLAKNDWPIGRLTLSGKTVSTGTIDYIPHVIGIVVNRVDTARRIHGLLNEREEKNGQVLLLTGRIRPIDR